MALKTVSQSNGYLYLNFIYNGVDLGKIIKEDLILKLQSYSKSFFWEDKTDQKTFQPDYLLSYPENNDSQFFTAAFKMDRLTNFYMDIQIKQNLISFSNKCSFQPEAILNYTFLTDI